MANAITISVIGDVGRLVSGLDTAESKLGKLGKAGGLVGKTLGAGLIAAGAAFVSFGVSSVKSLMRIERINSQTAQVIKSTGGAAGISAAHVEKLAGKLEGLTAAEAETTQEGANLLLTFTNIKNGVGKGNQIFDRTTSIMTDMSRALGQDTKSSAIQLGKALNDPIKGITALSRVGVSFTDQQKKTIGTLVESGNVMGAQKVILAELTKEFGGSGKAFAATTEGKIELAKHAFGTLGETIFAKLLPPLGNLADAATRGLAWANTQGPALTGFADVLGNRLAPALGIVSDVFGQVAPVVVALGTSVATNVLPVLTTLAATVTGDILPAILGLAGYLGANLLPIFTSVAGIVGGQIIPTLTAFAGFIYGTLLPAVIGIGTQIAGSLKPVLDQLFATIQSQILPTVAKVAAKFEQWRPTLQTAALGLVRITGAILGTAAAILGKLLPPLIRVAGFIFSRLVPAIAGGIGIIIRIGAAAIAAGVRVVSAAQSFATFAAKVRAKIADAMGVVAAVPGRIKGALSGAGSLLIGAGQDIIRGLITGIKSMVGQAASAAADAAKGALNAAKNALGINSPSREFKKLGRYSIEGFTLGITSGKQAIDSTLNNLLGQAAAAYKKRTGKTLDKDQRNRLGKTVAGEIKQLKTLATTYAPIGKTLTAARAKLGALVKVRNEYAAAVKTAASISLADVGQLDGGTVSADLIQDQLTRRLVDIQRFTRLISDLTVKGLNKTGLDQIIAKGVDGGGLATAEALAAGGRDTIASVNKLQAQISGAATTLATTSANSLYNAGIQAQHGLIEGLEADAKPLIKAAEKLGTKIANAIAGALGGKKNKNRLGKDLATDTSNEFRKHLGKDLITTGKRPKLTREALGKGAPGGASRDSVNIRLSAEQISQLQRGRELQSDLDAYQKAGGRKKK